MSLSRLALVGAVQLVLTSSLMAAAASPAQADVQTSADAATSSGPDPALLEEITVSATKIPQPVGEVSATVTVIDQAEIERRVVNDIRDLVRYEPNVSVRNNVGRFGLSGFNIRGLAGNRVLVEIDGIRVADGFSIGDFSSAGRNSVDVDALKAVEILRGPSSSLYGSNALAGVVTLLTKDPRDFLDPQAERDASLRFRAGHDSTDDSTTLGFTAAAASGPLSFMGLTTHRSGGPLSNRGVNAASNATRTVPNPQDIQNDALLSKVVYDWRDGVATRLTVDLNQSRSITDVLTGVREQRLGPTRIATDALSGDDRQSRSRIALDQSLRDLGFVTDATVTLYRQTTATEQSTVERRRTIPPAGPALPAERARDFSFDQTVSGAELVLRSDFATGSIGHRLVYGFEWLQTDTAQLRDGTQRNLLTGVVSSVVGPDVFPVRDFPLSRTREIAAFVQNEISLLDGRLTLIPGLRWDQYRLTPQPDPIFAADNPGISPVPIENRNASPKFGISYKFDPAWSLHANWAKGFRSPPYNDVNIGFTNLQFGYTAIPNPDLRPETSQGLELGLRVRGEPGSVALTTFYNEYDDFIESLASLGVDPATGLLVFQSRNLSRVAIYGAELRGALRLGYLHPSAEGLSVNAALGWSRGNDRDVEQPINSIDPAKATLGLRYDGASSLWNTELVFSAVTAKSRTDDSFRPLFNSPGYTTLDWYAQWQVLPQLRMDLALLNLTNRKYWQWADVRGRALDDPSLDRFTSPGRGAALNLVLEFQ